MRLIVPLLTLAGLAACQPHVPGELPRTGEVIETVNGKPVTQGMVDAMLSTLPEEYKAELEAQGKLDDLQDQLITQEILYQEAVAQGLPADPKVKNMLAVAEREALIEALLRQIADERTNDEALKAYYDENIQRFKTSKMHLMQVVADSEEAAKAAGDALVAGTPVGEVEGATDMSWVDARQIAMPQIAMAPAGTVVPPFQQGDKWLAVVVKDKKDEVVAFEDVKDTLKGEVQRSVVEEYVEELRTSTMGEGEATVTEPAAPAVPAPPAQ